MNMGSSALPLERSPTPAATEGIDLPVTRPMVPDRAFFDALVDGVFEKAWFTNEGPLVRRLAAELRECLGVEHCQLVSSGASALGLALDAVGLAPGAEIVTTPFTFAASTHAIALRGFVPVFADIDPETLCLDPEAAESAIGPDTGAILSTHIYGGVCDVEAFARIGTRRGVRIVYDGAHAFGTTIGGRSIFHWGDACALSFHATKIFHTMEGGAVITAKAGADMRVRIAKCHGIDGPDVPMIGPNAKMSELHAACGLTLIDLIPDEIADRRAVHAAYRATLEGLGFRFLTPRGCDWNHAYCPVLLPDENTVLRIRATLAAHGIEARRYFYPALNTLPQYAGAVCPVAEDAARRVLCLPMGGWLQASDVARICDTMAKAV